MSIFDRLQKQLDIQKREQGISALEIAELPPNLRKIMRVMLREVVMKRTDLLAHIETLPAANRLSLEELDSALGTLVEQNWLVRLGEDEFESYRVNLRRKSGTALNEDIWAALNSKIGSSPAPSEPDGES